MSETRSAVLAAARRLLDAGLVVATSGNVSGRASGGMWITPTRRAYGDMGEGDLVFVTRDGLAGSTAPSSEWRLHLATYGRRPDVGGIAHTHSPFATAWSLLDEPLLDTEDLAYYGLGAVPRLPRLAAGTAKLAVRTAAALADADAVLLDGHGVVTVGATPARAAQLAEVVERQAAVSWLARLADRAPATTDQDGHELALRLARRLVPTA